MKKTTNYVCKYTLKCEKNVKKEQIKLAVNAILGMEI